MPPYVKKDDCFWTDDDKAKLRQLADDGLSASQACQYFPGMTRNSACGLAFRNGITFNNGRGGNFLVGGEPRPKRERLAREKRQRKPRAMSQEPLDEPMPEPFMLELIDVNSGDCHFPFGDTNYKFCGLPTAFDKSYCRWHSAIVYNPPQERRRGESATLASI